MPRRALWAAVLLGAVLNCGGADRGGEATTTTARSEAPSTSATVGTSVAVDTSTTAGTSATAGTVATSDGDATGASATVPPEPTTSAETAPAGDPAADAVIGDGDPHTPHNAHGAGLPVALRVSIVDRYPHDRSAFTQGLELGEDGTLYEGTGLEGYSTVRKVDLSSGAVLSSTAAPPSVFGEGLTLVGDQLLQLSWRNGIAYVYDRATLSLLGEHAYAGEGWGLCYDGTELLQSDGTNRLRRRDPQTFAEIGALDVLDAGVAVTRLNELECVAGQVYANVWLSTQIVRIDPTSGAVTGRIDASALAPGGLGPDDVLNGIAYDAATDTFLLTGKRWPEVFRVTFEP